MLFSERFSLFVVIIIISFISLFYSINSYSTTYDSDTEFQLEYFALPSQTISGGALLVIPQQVLQNGTILPLTLGNLSSGAAIILPQDMLERGAILPLYLNKSTHSIYPKNSSNNSIIVVPEKMLSGGIIEIRKGNMSNGAAIILPQDALQEGAVLSFNKGNVSDGLLIILTKEVLNNRQIIQLPQGGAILPNTHTNMSQGAIIFLPSQIVEDIIIPLPQEKAILPITEANPTDDAIIILSNKSLDQGGTFQIPEGSDLQSFLHGDNLLSIPERGPPFPPPTNERGPEDPIERGPEDPIERGPEDPIERGPTDLVNTLNPILLPHNSFFVPKYAPPLYLPNNSLLLENNTKKLIQLPENSILVPNEGPLSQLNESALVVKNNYGHPINLPNGSLIGINGEILVPLPKVSLILNGTDAPITLPKEVSNGTDAPITLPKEVSFLIANGTGAPLPVPEGVSLLVVTDISPPFTPLGQTPSGTNLPFTPSKVSFLIVANGTGVPFPPPKVSLLITNGTGAPILLPEGAPLLIEKGTEVQNLVLNGSRIVNSNEGWFLIIPNSLGTIILPNDGQIIKNLPQGTIILPNDGQIIKNLPQGAIIMSKKVIKNLPQGAIIIPNKEILESNISVSGGEPKRDEITYISEPFLQLDGKNFIDVEHESQLQLQNFTLSVWFKTNKTEYIEPGHIVNKGGFNSEEEGNNMNYGIWMTNGSIVGGYETKAGESISVKSPMRYDDGKWHSAILINNGSTLRLDIDKQTVGTNSTNGKIPDYTGDRPFRIGANSLVEDKFFYGNIGDVRIWNRPLTNTEINEIYNTNNYSLKGQILFFNFGGISDQTPSGTSPSVTPPESRAELQTTTPPSPTITTNVTTPTTKEFNIAIAGDWGCETDTKETVKNIHDKNPELVIAAGDLSYNDNGQCWSQIIEPLSTKTKIAFGDHDYETVENKRVPQQYLLKYFNLTKTYYSFNHQNVHFLVMDPYREYGINSSQFKFVQDDLHSASLNQSINWIFVVEHVPIYTSPSENAADSTIRDIYHPLFDKYGVDLVISGDNHNYQRTFPLKYNDHIPSDPSITDTNKTYYDDLNGQIYLITGVGGRTHYKITQQAPFVATQNDKYFGYIDINIKGNNLEGFFYSNQVSVNEGRNNYTIIDKFSISKDT